MIYSWLWIYATPVIAITCHDNDLYGFTVRYLERAQRWWRQGFKNCGAKISINIPSSTGACSRTPCSYRSSPLASPFWGMKEDYWGQQQWWQWQHHDLYDPGFILGLTPVPRPSPCYMLTFRNGRKNFVIVVACIRDLHISSGYRLSGGTAAASGPAARPLPR